MLTSRPNHDAVSELIGLFSKAEYAEAAARAKAIAARFPQDAFAWKVLGAALRQLGRIEEALPPMQNAVTLSPDDAEAHNNLSATLRDLQRLGDAVVSASRALAIRPDFAEAWCNLGNAQRDLGELNNAAASYRRAVAIRPDYGVALSNLGYVLADLGQLDEAVLSCRDALKINPNDADAHTNLGVALQDLGKLDEAIASYRRAISLNPQCVEAYNSLGTVLLELGDFDEAGACYRRALAIQPDHAMAHSNLGNYLMTIDRPSEAEGSYRRAIEIKPTYFEAHSNLIFSHCYQPDRSGVELLAESRRFGELAARRARPYTRWDNDLSCDRCLRIGFVSGDLSSHPVGYFLESVLTAALAIGAGRLEFRAYSTSLRCDIVSDRIRACCQDWRSVVGVSDEELARQIHDDRVDILIDLAGHTARNRLPMFAWKPAPIQASWIGYLGTTGVAAIDYLIADHWCLPEAEDRNFTERIWRLPESYICFTPPRGEIPVLATPAISDGYVTFGCFNNLAKINEEVVALWGRILKAVSGSRLFLKTKQLSQGSARDEVRRRFALHGIPSESLILEGPAPRSELLASYHRVDIALDPFPYPGITTTVEALWMGVPVVTLAGDSFLSRQGVGLLTNAGLPDWIATDSGDYLARAVAHASDLEALSRLRAGLRQRIVESPLCDAPRFAQHFEAALRGMWRLWCAQQSTAPDSAIIRKEPAPHEVDKLSDLFKEARYAEALVLAQTVTKRFPDHPIGWKAVALALKRLGLAAEALAPARKAVALSADDAYAYSNLGNIQQSLGQRDEAVTSYRLAAKIKPDLSEVHSNLGLVLMELGQLSEAEVSCRRALEIDPSISQAHNNLGAILRGLGRLGEAVTSFRFALSLNPNAEDIHSNLGATLRDLGQLSEAAACCRRAIEINPNFAEGHNNLGIVLAALGKIEDAKVSYRRALEIKPDYAEAHSNLGNVLKDNGQLDEAVANCRRAVEISPGYASAHNNLGNVLTSLGHLDDAVSSYRKALELKPNYAQAHSNLLLTLLCQWGDDERVMAIERRHWNQQHALPFAPTISPHRNDRSPGRRLRIGYVSSDFRHHSVAFFLLPLLEAHDDGQVHVICYSMNAYADEVTKRFRDSTHEWRECFGQSDEDIVTQVRADRIDVLVDLSGHTAGNRLLVFARKPAPIQVTYLGYPDLTGIHAIDYRLTDSEADPIDIAEGPEKLIRLPETAWCFNPLEDGPPIRERLIKNCPDVTFACFNHAGKVTKDMLDLWGQILNQVPNSRLVLKNSAASTPSFTRGIHAFFAGLGIESHRVEILSRMPSRLEHLQSYHKVDIALDTFPYHGTTTTCEALWMGVPVVTLAGSSHVSRVGVSLLSSVGLRELVAYSKKDYVAKAAALACDLPRLSTLQSSLRQRMQQSPLMNAPRFARNVEAAYRSMWRRWCSKDD